MASSVSMSMPVVTAKLPGPEAFTRPLPVIIRPSGAVSRSRVQILTVAASSTLKEKAAAVLTATVISASVVLPEAAQAAGNDFSPSLKNFLLSIGAGGFVLVAILGAIIGVSNFDPVKRS